MPDIAGDKHAWNTRFEKKRLAIQGPAIYSFPVLLQIGSGQHESLFVAKDAGWKPFHNGLCADKYE